MKDQVDRDSWAYWYDLINTKERNDFEFYANLLDSNDLGLELACGTGRLYLKMMEQDYNVHGLDISENMLLRLKNKAKEKNIETNKLINEDLSNMDLKNEYDVIYYPFNSVCHITGSVEDKINVFSNIRDHLNNDGVFAFDMFVTDFDVIGDYGEIKSMNFEHNNTIYEFETWTEPVSESDMRIRSKNRIINLDNKNIVWDSYHNLSLYPKQQIELILKCAGFSDYSIYHEFTDKPLKDNSNIMSFVAEK